MNYITNEDLINQEKNKIKEKDYDWSEFEIREEIKEYDFLTLLDNIDPDFYYDHLTDYDPLKKEVDRILNQIKEGQAIAPISMIGFVLIYGIPHLLAAEKAGVKSIPVIELTLKKRR